MNKGEVAARSTEAGISKKEAREQLALEKRAAAVRAAGGEVLPLPVAVDREGTLLPLPVELAAQVVRSAIDRAGALTLDVETSGYPLGHELYRLRTVQLGDEHAAVVFDPTQHADVIRELLAAAPALHAHSATADLIPCAHAGLLDIDSGWDRMYDTAIPAVLGGADATGTTEAGLKAIAPAMLGPDSTVETADDARAALFKTAGWLKETKPTTPLAKNGWAQVDSGSATMIRYAASDVLDTAAIGRRLPALPPTVLHRERLAQRMTARVADVGVRLDGEHIATMTANHTAALAEAASRARAFGIEKPGSDQELAQRLLALGVTLPRTKTGRPSVAKDVLGPLAGVAGPVGELVTAVLDYRHNETVLGLFLEPYRQLVADGDGRARPTVLTLGTRTGRMSCRGPNLQQLSKKGGVRACITADPGDLIISADFSGVELRVAAALSGDPTLTEIIREDRDLHAEIALQVWGADEELSKEKGKPTPRGSDRSIAKRLVFGRLYGGQVPTLAAQTGISQSLAQSVVDRLDEMAPQLAEWSAWLKRQVRAGHTKFPAYSGRTIHLPAMETHAAPNYAIQGSARELLVDTLVRWRDTRWGNCPLIPVHDELLVFVPAEDAQEATAVLSAAMTHELNGIPIVAEADPPMFAWQDAK